MARKNDYIGGDYSKLSWDISEYTPYEIGRMPENIARKEYTKLRDIAQKRLRRMESAGYQEMNVYRYNVNRYEKLRDMPEGMLKYRLAELADFISNPYSTLRGMAAVRKKSYETLSRTYGNIKKKDLDLFGRFMEQYRFTNKGAKNTYGSQRAARFFNTLAGSGAGRKTLINAFELYRQDQRT